MNALRTGNATQTPFYSSGPSTYTPISASNGTAQDIRRVGPETVWVRNVNPYDTAASTGLNITGVDPQGNYTTCLTSWLPIHEQCCQAGGGFFVNLQSESTGIHPYNTNEAKDPASGDATAPALIRWCALPFNPISPTSNGPFQIPQANEDFADCVRSAANGTGRGVDQAASDVTVEGSIVWECHAFEWSQDQGRGSVITGLNEYVASSNETSSSGGSNSGAGRGLSKVGWLGAAMGLVAVLPAVIGSLGA